MASLENVSLAFNGQTVLRSLNLLVRRGAALLIGGANGSGKTSLLNVLSGFLRPSAGKVTLFVGGATFNPADMGPEVAARFGLGRLWQDVRLFPSMTALDNVLMGTQRPAGRNPLYATLFWPLASRELRDASARALRNLEVVGLRGRARSSADKLSLGEMKKVALARLLQQEAAVLLLDEPMAGLDEAASSDLMDLLGRLTRLEGKTLVIIEHQRDAVSSICDETWILTDGALHREALVP